MPRGYRCIILAIVGWLILAAAPAPNQGGKTEQQKARSDIEQSLSTIANAQAEAVEQAKPGEYQRPCSREQDNRASDLCAQWQAAVAARDAAKWAYWSFLLGIAGTLGLLATLYYTREAVRIAGAATKDADTALAIAARNADAAAAQVRVSEDTANRQLRAYVQISRVEVKNFSVGSRPTYTAHFKNTGQTPAYDFECGVAAVDLRGAEPDNFRPRFPAYPFGSRFALSPGEPYQVDVRPNEPILDAHMLAFQNGMFHPMIFGVYRYRDAFKRRRYGVIKFIFKPDLLNADGSGSLTGCVKGNRTN